MEALFLAVKNVNLPLQEREAARKEIMKKLTSSMRKYAVMSEVERQPFAENYKSLQEVMLQYSSPLTAPQTQPRLPVSIDNLSVLALLAKAIDAALVRVHLLSEHIARICQGTGIGADADAECRRFANLQAASVTALRKLTAMAVNLNSRIDVYAILQAHSEGVEADRAILGYFADRAPQTPGWWDRLWQWATAKLWDAVSYVDRYRWLESWLGKKPGNTGVPSREYSAKFCNVPNLFFALDPTNPTNRVFRHESFRAPFTAAFEAMQVGVTALGRIDAFLIQSLYSQSPDTPGLPTVSLSAEDEAMVRISTLGKIKEYLTFWRVITMLYAGPAILAGLVAVLPSVVGGPIVSVFASVGAYVEIKKRVVEQAVWYPGLFFGALVAGWRYSQWRHRLKVAFVLEDNAAYLAKLTPGARARATASLTSAASLAAYTVPARQSRSWLKALGALTACATLLATETTLVYGLIGYIPAFPKAVFQTKIADIDEANPFIEQGSRAYFEPIFEADLEVISKCGYPQLVSLHSRTLISSANFTGIESSARGAKDAIEMPELGPQNAEFFVDRSAELYGDANMTRREIVYIGKISNIIGETRDLGARKATRELAGTNQAVGIFDFFMQANDPGARHMTMIGGPAGDEVSAVFGQSFSAGVMHAASQPGRFRQIPGTAASRLAEQMQDGTVSFIEGMSYLTRQYAWSVAPVKPLAAPVVAATSLASGSLSIVRFVASENKWQYVMGGADLTMAAYPVAFGVTWAGLAYAGVPAMAAAPVSALPLAVVWVTQKLLLGDDPEPGEGFKNLTPEEIQERLQILALVVLKNTLAELAYNDLVGLGVSESDPRENLGTPGDQEYDTLFKYLEQGTWSETTNLNSLLLRIPARRIRATASKFLQLESTGASLTDMIEAFTRPTPLLPPVERERVEP